MNILTMRELTKFAIGGGWGAEELQDDTNEVTVIRGADFPAAAFQDISSAPIRFEKSSRIPNRVLNPGDIVLEVSGGTKARPTGRTIFITQKMVNDADSPLIPASFCRRLVIDTEKAVPHFVYYWLQNMYAKGQTWNYQNRSTGIANFQFEQFLDRETVRLPNRQEQLKIAHLLGALDDKLAANQTSISKIDEILRALWQKELSLSNVSASLSSLASFINGRAFTKGASGTGRVVVRIAEMNSGIGSRTVYNDIDAAPDNVVDPGELLFSWSGTLMTKRWPFDQAIVNQHIFKVVPNGQLDLWALRQAIDAQLEYFQMIAAGKATTMGHIKRGDLDQEVEVPAQMSEETNQLGNSLWRLATSLEIQNLQLARTRDELLPLLMSGRITVGEAEEVANVAGTAAWES
ncbi:MULTISPECIES: restriction endonuclease subunit S [Corynebacterium]|uniref:restriction endonuclease subunit S n=1 Tax=Corynebacterium TaxID=1716 RepID=UPI001CE44926|nr:MULTISPECIES: restriction endonuclease subunit S [unclassified Corynebacterium]MDK8524804.1 restriction endonuclease subunit S [Corynebacterium sp. MSK150]